MPTQTQHRMAYWDNLKGLMILLVVFAHILLSLPIRSELLNQVVDFIYMFHMPVFVFVSGFFGKSDRARSWQSLAKLLFLYFIFNSFMGFFYGLEPLLVPKYSYWYLLALLVWRPITPYLAAFPHIQMALLGLSLLVGYFASIDNTFSLARVICFYPYYMAGYLLDTAQANELACLAYKRRFPRGLLALGVAMVLAVGFESVFHYTNTSLQMFSYTNISNGAIGRVGLYGIAFAAIYALRYLMSNRSVFLLTQFGKNSLWIFLFHRPVTLLLACVFKNQPDGFILLGALLMSVLLCVCFGHVWVADFMNKFAADGAALLHPHQKTRFHITKVMTLCVCAGFLFMVLKRGYTGFAWENVERKIFPPQETTVVLLPKDLPRVMSAEQQKAFDQAFRITFAGDLILLEDQVKRGYRGDKYDFSDVFAYAKPYISSADLAIGVFEGPTAGAAAGYSTSNFADGKELFLNFPDEFASAVKDAGFDLVTTANNHLLDKGLVGALRTLDVLDRIGLDHTGSYRDRNEKEKNHIKWIEKDGIKMAVLSYTYGSNYIDTAALLEGELEHLTSVVSDTQGPLFEKMKERVEQDFKKAKALNPDLVIVLPHLGTQFSNQPDSVQETWFKIFKENGADIILGDHAHAVQPILLEEKEGKTTVTAYCPGNFANIYRQNQGDTSVLIEVYIDRSSKKIIGVGAVPLYTQAAADGNYRALPIYQMLHNASLRKQLSTDDLERARMSHAIITEVLFGHAWDMSALTPRYYMDKQGFLRVKHQGLPWQEKMQKSAFLQALQSADERICFVGDSVTEGTKNEGYPWYEPLEPFLPARTILNYSRGGATVGDLLNQADQIPSAQAYVIALGTNDVRYREENRCAMDPEAFIEKIDLLRKKLMQKSPNAVFVFIAPWYSTDGDPFSSLSFSEKNKLNKSYTDALAKYCQEHQAVCINPNPYIAQTLERYPQEDYLLDHIHPNAGQGIRLYSQAVLLSSVK